ncbi:UPAR/Ly6 domain-containing protein crim-like [Haliotis cracherodii]|uniref:uncharacterized protein LOC124117758 n=1 Tax=Haliotis rufescens TaxID=6454 RepID=UPI001EB068EA|nr:uncharacterized protein LOC124117758 [Haliotis rufescens]
MGTEWLLALLSAILIFKEGEGLMCHRCFSAMGGCGDEVVWRMFPWRDCGPSNFCVKVIEKVPGQEPKYIRECEHELMKSTRHRLRMPNLRRHGYCLPARKNDPFNPLDLTNSQITYCFCNEYNGCNGASDIKLKYVPALVFTSLVTLLLSRLF